MYVPREYRAVQRLIRMHYVVCDVYRLYEFYDIYQTMVVQNCSRLVMQLLHKQAGFATCHSA